MGDRVPSQFRLVYRKSRALNGRPDEEMRAAIWRAIVHHHYALRIYAVEVVCTWHTGGREEDVFADPLEHCTFRGLHQDDKFVVTLHAYPEHVIPVGNAQRNPDWRSPSGCPALSTIISNQYNRARAALRVSGVPNQGPTRSRFQYEVADDMASHQIRERKSEQRAQLTNISGLSYNSAQKFVPNASEQPTPTHAGVEHLPRTRGPAVQYGPVASAFPAALKQENIPGALSSSNGPYVPPHMRSTNSNVLSKTEALQSAAMPIRDKENQQRRFAYANSLFVPAFSDVDTSSTRLTSAITYQRLGRGPLADKPTNTNLVLSQARFRTLLQQQSKYNTNARIGNKSGIKSSWHRN